jgi:anti-sigma regulatory factor (Ser/Thr protein kinase)/DNA-binding XRE family transcriptional regulator
MDSYYHPLPQDAPPRDGINDDALLLGSVTVPGQPEHVRAARSFAVLALGEDHADADTVVLLISEMVTNSIQHSGSHHHGGTITIALFAMPGGIRAEVTDEGGPTIPTLRSGPHGSAEMAESWRGLRLVDTLSTRWGHYRDEASAVTWFELATPPSNMPRTIKDMGTTTAGPDLSPSGCPSSLVGSQPAPALPIADSGRTIPPRTTVLDGARLRRLRRLRGLSQERLASHAGISLTTVTRLESQSCAPCRCRTLGRLAAALGEHPAAILPDAGPGTGTGTLKHRFPTVRMTTGILTAGPSRPAAVSARTRRF